MVGLGKGFLSVRLVLWASSHLHGLMIDRILHSPMKFFDQTPTGKIINRFSKDMDECKMFHPSQDFDFKL